MDQIIAGGRVVPLNLQQIPYESYATKVATRMDLQSV